MKFKYVLNINSNNNYNRDPFFGETKVTNVFDREFLRSEYKQDKVLKRICKDKVRELEDKYIDNGNTTAIGFDEPVYIIFSGLTVVLIALIAELVREGYNPIVLFEDKDQGGYYKMEARS